MQSDWAAENLQVIRTLMERSAIYRRALAPMTLLAGGVGTTAAITGQWMRLEAVRPFIFYWLGVAVIAVLGAAFLVRRQALQAGEAFWSPPARRVVRAALPAAVVALVLTLGGLLIGTNAGDGEGGPPLALVVLPAGWSLLYGLGLNAAGFFMPRGIQLFGWVLIGGGSLSLLAFGARVACAPAGHWLMGLHFGLLHLAYGFYLLFTEKSGSRP